MEAKGMKNKQKQFLMSKVFSSSGKKFVQMFYFCKKNVSCFFACFSNAAFSDILQVFDHLRLVWKKDKKGF